MSVTIISKKNIEPINFLFGESLSDPGRKTFDFEKNCPGVRVCVCVCVCVGGWGVGGGGGWGVRNLALMIRDRRNVRVAITPKRRVLDM